MIPREFISGAVLAGGEGRRMRGDGGAPVEKGLLSLRGRPLVAWSVRCLAPHVACVFISANRHADEYGRHGQVVPDDPALGELSGPLAGVASVMAQIETPWLMTLPVDVPLLPLDLVARLSEAASRQGVAVAYARAAREHPLCMLAHRDVLPGLRRTLLAGERKVRLWQAAEGAVAVPFADESAFFNINGPGDLDEAARMLAARPHACQWA